MKRLAIVFFFLLSAGCGTDTGNPMTMNNGQSGDPQPDPNSPHQGLPEISDLLCARLRGCFATVPADCEPRVDDAPHVTAALGLDPAVFPTLVSVRLGVSQGRLAMSRPDAEACSAALAETPCSDPMIQQAYDPANPENFDQVHRLLNASPGCRRMIR